MSPHLRLVAMPTHEELELRRRRRAWWLRVARESRGLSQGGVAESLGLSRKSASTVGDWERYVSDPSLRQLEMLAVLYGVPLAMFTDPPETDEERLDRIVSGASALEREDWEAGERGSTPGADDEPDGAPRRRSA